MRRPAVSHSTTSTFRALAAWSASKSTAPGPAPRAGAPIHSRRAPPKSEAGRRRRHGSVSAAQRRTRLPSLLQAVSQLADGGGLAHAVDTDEQHHAGLGGEVQSRLPHCHLLRQHIRSAASPTPGPEAFPFDLNSKLLHRVHSRIQPQVRQDQRLLQLLEKGLVRLRKAREEIRGNFLICQKAHSTRPFALFFLFPGSFAP